MYAFVFPGQGSQAVGMGKEVYDAFPIARQVFEEVDETIKQPLSKLIFEGPQDALTLTENTQPALMAVSMAIMRVLEVEVGIDIKSKVACMAGHSLGEYSALTAAGVLQLSDTAKLLRLRGQSMQKAVPVGQGAMAAIIGLDYDAVAAITNEISNSEICVIANDNAPGQLIISGHSAAVAKAIELATARGSKRAIQLPVSAPFHCPLMQPATAVMDEALQEVTFKPPVVPIVVNVTASFERDVEVLRQSLVKQITGQVRWRESVMSFADKGVTSVVEIGAGRVLTGLTKRIDPNLRTVTINNPHDIEAFSKPF